MNKIRMALAILTVILIGISFQVCSASDNESFVDATVYNAMLFEEDPADEFLAEKREINRLYEKFFSDYKTHNILETKIGELEEKLVAKYGDEYDDLDVGRVHLKMLAVSFDFDFTYQLQEKFADYGTDLADRLKDDKTWAEIETAIHNEFENTAIPPEVNFRMDQKFVSLCKEVLGENDSITLRHTINLIHDYSLLGDSKSALSMAKKFLPKVEKVFGKNSREVAELLSLMADDYATLGNYRAGEETLRKAIDVNKKIHGNETSPELITNLVALAKLNPSPETMEALDEAAKNFSEDELYRLGYFRVKLLATPNQDLDSTVDLIGVNEREFALIDETSRNYIATWIDILFAESEGSRMLGHYGFSLNVDLMVFSMCKAFLGDYHHKTLAAMCNLSDDYLMLNQTDDALTLAEYAFDTSQEIYGNKHPCTVRAIHNLTNVYRKMGRYDDAWANDYAALEVSKKVFVEGSVIPAEKMIIYADLAADAEGLKNFPSAIKFYETFLELAELDEKRDAKIANVRKNLARLYNLTGKHEKTVALYDFLRKDDSYSLDGLNTGGLIAAHTADALAQALVAVGKNDAASEIYLQEETILEGVRLFNTHYTNESQRDLFAQTVPYYKNAASFFIEQGNDLKAFIRVELCKGRTLADQYGELLSIYKSGATDSEIKTLNEHRNKISAFREKFSDEFTNGSNALKLNLINTRLNILRDYDGYKSQLREKYPQYEELAEGSWIMTYRAVNNLVESKEPNELLPPNHCYISFAAAEDELLAFVADSSGKVRSFSTPVDENFFDNCRAYNALLEHDSLGRNKFLWQLPDGNYKLTRERQSPTKDAKPLKSAEEFFSARQKLSAQLGEILLAPLTQFTAEKKTWIISPDAELNLVPFETLTLGGEIVINSKNICYVPSLAVLKLMTDAGKKNSRLFDRKELFAMGNAVYSGVANSKSRGFSEITRNHGTLSNLPGSAEELKKVSELFPKNSQAVMTGNEASERNLKQLDSNGTLAQYKRIIFSAHGIFVPERPELSSIVLSQNFDADFDGYVTVGEWMGYNLNSDLIYLSACESGRGDYQAGEGIVGIPYALTVAGNKDTVMSLWKVRDTATAKFTSAVFEKLSRGKSEVDAINETKREFLNSPDSELNTPTVWAAFVLYGI